MTALQTLDSMGISESAKPTISILPVEPVTTQYSKPLAELDKNFIRHGISGSFNKLYVLGRTAGNLSVIVTGGLLAGPKGLLISTALELLNHARRSTRRHTPHMRASINQAQTRFVARNWDALAAAGIARRIKAGTAPAPITMARRIKAGKAPIPLILKQPRFSIWALPAEVRSDFVRTAITLGFRHAGFSPASQQHGKRSPGLKRSFG